MLSSRSWGPKLTVDFGDAPVVYSSHFHSVGIQWSNGFMICIALEVSWFNFLWVYFNSIKTFLCWCFSWKYSKLDGQGAQGVAEQLVVFHCVFYLGFLHPFGLAKRNNKPWSMILSMINQMIGGSSANSFIRNLWTLHHLTKAWEPLITARYDQANPDTSSHTKISAPCHVWWHRMDSLRAKLFYPNSCRHQLRQYGHLLSERRCDARGPLAGRVRTPRAPGRKWSMFQIWQLLLSPKYRGPMVENFTAWCTPVWSKGASWSTLVAQAHLHPCYHEPCAPLLAAGPMDGWAKETWGRKHSKTGAPLLRISCPLAFNSCLSSPCDP